ncbi:hypothetical protein dsmv_3825 [Desulfococcus multivorans DSM 2059]|uniref:Uncharacterized protein n=1 Tax=Desulfococcus multivorans DSM 2059 TaxID=1121405 RepID=S7VBF8_DESML|nr:uncharacterized protein Dmul_37580 [Desulfococcus multivorans]EPR44059.1 hypothetical protein dsmv_3825 [Desulfococcus multivorans DSM 2059]SKA24688.1 hypothetical protein SAMN02745446_03505 [Desulfococcus multivorans DSM 2059]
MDVSTYPIDVDRYAKCIEVSKRVRWDIDRDVIRGRRFDFSQKFLPDGISKVAEFDFLNDDEKRLLSQIQGRTYANMFGFVERFITAKVLEITRGHWLGNSLEGRDHPRHHGRVGVAPGEQQADHRGTGPGR